MDTTRSLTPVEVIDRVRAARRNEHAAALEQLEMAVEWARLHPCPADEWPAHWGDPRLDEQVVPIAGPGAPLVAEWAPVEARRRPGPHCGPGPAAGRRGPRTDLPAPAVVVPHPIRGHPGLEGPDDRRAHLRPRT